MEHLHHLVNYRAILICAIILWIIGALWYSPPLFGKHWAAIVGRKTGEKPKGVVWGMIASFIGDFLLAFVLAHVILWSHADSGLDGTPHRPADVGRLRRRNPLPQLHLRRPRRQVLHD